MKQFEPLIGESHGEGETPIESPGPGSRAVALVGRA
jgi:hypothetical protein